MPKLIPERLAKCQWRNGFNYDSLQPQTTPEHPEF